MQTNAVKDEKASFIKSSLADGRTREEIAALLGYKTWRSLDIYMRRTGARWNSRLHTYTYEEKTGDETVITDEASPRVAAVIRKFSGKDADPMSIAKEAGFVDHRELSAYMSARGYKWSVKINNYIKAPAGDGGKEPQVISSKDGGTPAGSVHQEPGGTDMQKYFPFMELLYQNRERLFDFLNRPLSSGAVPRYAVPGITRTKSFYMSDRLSRLVAEFSQARNISQKEVIEAAVIEFLQNHSFKKEVDALLERV